MTRHMSSLSERTSHTNPPTYQYTESEMDSLLSSLSLEETYYLADISQRKSRDRTVREDLRLKLGHCNVLGSLLQDIAKRESPPPSPKQKATQLIRPTLATPSSSSSKSSSSKSSPTAQKQTPPAPVYDEYGFAYDDGSSDEEEENGLSLTRTISRRN